VTARARLITVVLGLLLLGWSLWQTADFVAGDASAPKPTPTTGRTYSGPPPGPPEIASFGVKSVGGVLGRLGELGFSRVAVLRRGRPTKVTALEGSGGELTASTLYRLRRGRVRVSQTTGPSRSAGRTFVIRYTKDGIRYLPARSWRARGYVVAMRPFRRNYRRRVVWLQYLCLGGAEGPRCP
jgi:hypothetical protein